MRCGGLLVGGGPAEKRLDGRKPALFRQDGDENGCEYGLKAKYNVSRDLLVIWSVLQDRPVIWMSSRQIQRL